MYWYDNLIRRFLSCSLLIHQQCHIVLTICTTHIHHLQVTQKGSHITNSVFAATKILFRHLIAIAHTPTATFHQSNKNFISTFNRNSTHTNSNVSSKQQKFHVCIARIHTEKEMFQATESSWNPSQQHASIQN